MLGAAQRRSWIGERAQLHQNERQLERTPRRRTCTLRRHFCLRLFDRHRRVRGSCRSDLGRHTLVTHHSVHEPEAPQRLGIGGDVLQSINKPLVRLASLPQHQLSSLLQVRRQPLGLDLLLVKPRAVPGYQRFEPGAQFGRLYQRQSIHRQLGVLYRTRPCLRRLTHGQPRRRHLGRPTRTLPRHPIHRAGAADRELQPIPVLEVQPLDFLVVLGPVLLQHIAYRQEYLGPTRVNPQLCLEHPHAHRDRHRRLPVVAQRDLYQYPLELRIVVPVQPQTNRLAQRDRRRLPRRQVAPHDRPGLLYRGPLIVADRTAGLGQLVGLDRRVSAPRRGDGECVQVGRHLEAQPHRRRDHHALLRRAVLGVVILSVSLGLVGREGRNTALLARRVVIHPRLDQLTPLSGLIAVVVRQRGPRELHWCDVPHKVLRSGTEWQHLLRTVDRAQQLTLQDVSHILPHRERPAIQLVVQLIGCLRPRSGCHVTHENSVSIPSDRALGSRPLVADFGFSAASAAARRWFSSRRRSRISVRAAGPMVQRSV